MSSKEGAGKLENRRGTPEFMLQAMSRAESRGPTADIQEPFILGHQRSMGMGRSVPSRRQESTYIEFHRVPRIRAINRMCHQDTPCG